MSKPRRNPNDPYRVIVWGPGGVGQACIREIIKRPEFKLVGVMGFSKEKIGKDVGELIGLPPLGLKISGDKEAMFALEADVVIWVGNPFADMNAMEEEILHLLELGKNVLISVGHHYPPRHGKAYVERIEAACRKGNSSLYGAGENPGFWFERMVPTLTGLCTSVESVFLDEYVDCAVGGTNAETLAGVGFGLTLEQIEQQAEFMQRMWREYFYVESMEMIAQSTWGRPMERFDVGQKFYLAEKDVVLDKAKGDPITMTIPTGRILGMSYIFTGFIDAQPRLKIQVNWFLRPENSPFVHKTDDIWKLEIEAQPVSLRCQFEAFASLNGNLKHRPGDATSPFMYVTGVPLVQAIPIVVAHEPGFVVPSVFANCVPDFRQLENRKSLVDVHHYPE